jgi:hypothetical protein
MFGAQAQFSGWSFEELTVGASALAFVTGLAFTF